MPERAEATVPGDERSRIDTRVLAWRLALVLIALFVIGLLLGAYFREETLAWSERFVETLGGPGIFIGLLIPDAFPVPLPHDAFLTFGLFGGLGFWRSVAWGGAGSIAGAVVGYFVGRWLATTRPYTLVMKRIGSRANAVVERYGVMGLGLSAVTPIPFGACCWAAGAFDMRFGVFFAVIQVRWVRVAGYLWLIQAGFLSS